MAVETTPESGIFVPKWILMVIALSLGGGFYYFASSSPSQTISHVTSDGPVEWLAIADSEKLFKEGKKPILYDFSAAWCGPCRTLKSEVFGDTEIANKINQFYIPVSVVDRVREDGKNADDVQALFNKYRINSIPTLIVKMPNGHEETLVGYHGKTETIKFLQAQLASLKK